MGYSPRYHIYTNEFPDQHSETDDWACVESEMRRAKESGAIKADYAAYVIDTHTGQITYFDSTGVKSPHGGRPMTLREVMDAEAPAQPPCSESATPSDKWYMEYQAAVARAVQAEAECATLRKERDDALEWFRRDYGLPEDGDFVTVMRLIDDARGRAGDAEAQLSTLRDALKKYGHHAFTCKTRSIKIAADRLKPIDESKCNCGLTAALAPTPEVAPKE